MEVSREVLTRLSALAQGRHKRPPHVCDGGLAGHAGTGTYSWGHLLRGYRLKIDTRVQDSRWRCPCLHQLAVLNAG